MLKALQGEQGMYFHYDELYTTLADDAEEMMLKTSEYVMEHVNIGWK